MVPGSPIRFPPWPVLFVPALFLAVGCGEGPSGATALAPGASDRVPDGYVGDAACASCHLEISEEYAGTKKARSLIPFRAQEAPERFEPTVRVHNEATDLHYEALLHDGAHVQRELRLGDRGQVLHDLSFPADLVIGSGNQTRSYLMVRNGRVTQMPLTWYAHREVWDMSPGYAEANDRFSRKIILACLNCHGDVPLRTPHTQNHYQELPGPISCERCHGPGREHVEARERDDAVAEGDPDPWIVTPTRLERDRELSVCAQCHLAGVMAFRPGEGPATFLPGMHLAEHRTVWVPELQLTDPEWVGIDSHPVRLARSACFQATEMTCTTCHLPHTPDDALPPDHYDRVCASCHMGTGEEGHGEVCGRPEVHEGADPTTGSCTRCHMQAGGTSDVPHVRFTDHWIRPEPGPPLSPDAGRPVIESPEPLPLVALSPRGERAGEAYFAGRSFGERLAGAAEALFHFYETMHRHPGYLPRVVELGRGAEGEGDGTVPGAVALGRALLAMDSVDAAEEVLREAMEAAPDDPWPAFLVGALLEERRGRSREALPYLQRAVALQPEFLEARRKLAEALYDVGRRAEARDELEEVVARDPLHEPGAWLNLGVVRLEMGDEAGAARAFREASRLDPDRAEAHIQVGTLALGAGELAEAERAFLAAIAAAPEEPAAHGSLALVHLQRGEWARARELLERVLELDPENPGARELLGEMDRQGLP